MFDLETGVQNWRRRMERRSSLSAREVDELEDHLRARIDLELELDAGLVPAQAFAVARDDIGEATTLSREFAKAGTPRWRKVLVAGWAMFATSFFLPAFGTNLFGHQSWDSGYQVVWDILSDGAVPFMLPNLGMLLTLGLLRDPRPRGRRIERILKVAGWAGIGTGLLGLWILVRTMQSAGSGIFMVGIGYWVWTVSLICMAAALRARTRELVSAEPKKVTA